MVCWSEIDNGKLGEYQCPSLLLPGRDKEGRLVIRGKSDSVMGRTVMQEEWDRDKFDGSHNPL